MEFNGGKSELIHFIRAHPASAQRLRLRNAMTAPVESAPFFGGGSGSTGNYAGEPTSRKIKTKLEKQRYALSHAHCSVSVW